MSLYIYTLYYSKREGDVIDSVLTSYGNLMHGEELQWGFKLIYLDLFKGEMLTFFGQASCENGG